jgi:transposase
LHALLRELMAGGAPISLTPVSATRALHGLRPRTGPDRIRVELAKDLIADVRRLDEQLAANAAKMTALLDEHGTRLRDVDGIGPVLAARLLGRTGPASRFASAAAIYIIAMTQIRMPASADRAFYDKKIAEGKPPRFATRALKRHLADPLWRLMLADETRTARASSKVAANAC